MADENKEPMRVLIRKVESQNRVEGLLVSGKINKGDCVNTIPTGQQSTVISLEHDGNAIESASADTTLAIDLAYSVKLREGDVLACADHSPEYADQFEANLSWLANEELLPGRSYRLQTITGMADASISRLKYRVNKDSNQQIAAKTLECGQDGVANISLTSPIIFDPVLTCGKLGRFQLLDRESHEAVAEGEIRHALRRASNIHWQALDVDKESRATIKNQTPRIIWLTGLSGSGKSTIANLLEKKLLADSHHSYLLDGDNVRHGLNKDLGFTAADRVENIRRVAETAKLMLDAGLIVITSFISPFRAERDMARTLFAEGEFIEVFIDTSLEVCEQRDPKGLYHKARAGELRNFTGIDSPYEPPENPEMTLDTVALSVEEAADQILEYLKLRDG